jgi:hypothetical protein
VLFNIEHDAGDRVVGYCVPDGFSAIPRLRVCASGRVLLCMEANEPRLALVTAGRHETGLCGFTIDESKVPRLAALPDLEVYDDETDILIYRRAHEGFIRRKVVRVETQLFPLWRLDDAIRGRFQHSVRGVEMLGRETVTQLLLLNQIESSYLAGRFLYRNYEMYLASGFDVVSLIQNPYDELAERLLVLREIGRSEVASGILGPRDAMVYAPVIAFARNLPLDNPRDLKRALRSMPGEVAARLANPLVRQLSASTPDEMPNGAAVAVSLLALSSFKLVGLRHAPDQAVACLAEMLALDDRRLPIPAPFGTVSPLAALMREIGSLEVLLENDLEVYHHVAEASQKAAEAAA